MNMQLIIYGHIIYCTRVNPEKYVCITHNTHHSSISIYIYPLLSAGTFLFIFGGSEFVTEHFVNRNLAVALNHINAFMHSYDCCCFHVFLHLLSHSIVPGDRPETPN